MGSEMCIRDSLERCHSTSWIPPETIPRILADIFAYGGENNANPAREQYNHSTPWDAIDNLAQIYQVDNTTLGKMVGTHMLAFGKQIPEDVPRISSARPERRVYREAIKEEEISEEGDERDDTVVLDRVPLPRKAKLTRFEQGKHGKRGEPSDAPEASSKKAPRKPAESFHNPRSICPELTTADLQKKIESLLERYEPNNRRLRAKRVREEEEQRQVEEPRRRKADKALVRPKGTSQQREAYMRHADAMVSEQITETLHSRHRRKGHEVTWMPTGISNLDYDPKLDSAENLNSIATSKSNKDKFIVWYLGDPQDEKSQKVRVNVLWNPTNKAVSYTHLTLPTSV